MCKQTLTSVVTKPLPSFQNREYRQQLSPRVSRLVPRAIARNGAPLRRTSPKATPQRPAIRATPLLGGGRLLPHKEREALPRGDLPSLSEEMLPGQS